MLNSLDFLKYMDLDNPEEVESSIKEITKALADLDLEIKASLNFKSILKKERTSLQRRIHVIKNKPDETVVTDHALVRFMERVMGLDVHEIIDKHILNDNVRSTINAIGQNGKFPIDENSIAIVQNNTIVTIIPTSEEK